MAAKNLINGLGASSELESYKQFCYQAIPELMVLRPKNEIMQYLKRAEQTKTERELSRVMTDVRNMI